MHRTGRAQKSFLKAAGGFLQATLRPIHYPMKHGTAILLQLFALLLTITAALAATGNSDGQQATIKELTATTTERSLIVFATLANSFTAEMNEVLHSGLALHFSFFVELHKTTEKWPDELIATRNFQHIMTFDTLKETYKVTLEEENNKVTTFRSLPEAKKRINEINGVKIIDLQQLLPDHTYKLSIRAELYQKTLPMSLHNILPFLSWWDVETEWHTITFTYQAAVP